SRPRARTWHRAGGGLVASSRDHARRRAIRETGTAAPLAELVLVDPVGEEAERHAGVGIGPRDLTGRAVVPEGARTDHPSHAPHVRAFAFALDDETAR